MVVKDHGNHVAVCPVCTRIVTRDDSDAVASIVENHNEQRHEGDRIARLVGPTEAELNEFMDYVREEHGTEVYGDIGAYIVENDPWGVLNV